MSVTTDLSLFKFFACISPERHSGDKTLPIIPNEIYLHILQHIPSRDFRTLARLRGACKFFANACLPHMFEDLEFYSFQTPPYSMSLQVGKSSGRILFFQIAAKQPSSLTLAKSVRDLRLNNVRADGWTKSFTPTCHLSSISLMTNIRRLTLLNSLVNDDYWRTMVSLPFLEELRFYLCAFLPNTPYVEPEIMGKLRFSLLEANSCDGHFQPMPFLDACSLCSLDVSLNVLLDIQDVLPQSALTELTLSGYYRCPSPDEHPWDLHIIQMRDILVKLPHSIQTLSISVYDLVEDQIFDGSTEDILQFIFTSPTWSNFHHLRSLKFEVNHNHDGATDILSAAWDGISQLTSLQSLVVECPICFNNGESNMPYSDIRLILRDRLDPRSCLTYINILGIALRLVDGEWTEVHNSSCTV